MNTHFQTILLILASLLLSCNNGETNKNPEANKSERIYSQANKAVSDIEFYTDWKMLTKDFMTWYNYTYYNVRLSQNFIGLDLDSSMIDKKAFLNKLIEANVVAFKIKVTQGKPVYQLFELSSDDENIGIYSKQMAVTEKEHFDMEGENMPIFRFTDLNGKFYDNSSTKEKIIALSFDDGPNGADTEHIADILKKHHVPATFFQVGGNIERHPEITKRLAAEGHTIGNHLYSHRFRIYRSSKLFTDELVRNQSLVNKVIGHQPHLFRSPWLFRTRTLLKIVRQNKLVAISGSFGNNWEVLQPSAQRIATSATKSARPGSILIFHDGYNAKGGDRAETARAIEILIPRLKQAGYQFVTVDTLLNIPAYQS